MNGYFWFQLSGFSIILPSLIGVIRFKRMLKSYRPFVIFLIIALLNEIADRVIIAVEANDAVVNNIYTLADYCIVVVIFLFLDEKNNKKNYYLLLAFGLLAWVVDNILLHSITGTGSYFRILYGLIVVYLSVNKLNEVFFSEVRYSLKNAALLICIALIISYTYQSVFEIFVVIKMPISDALYIKLFYIIAIINLFCNLLFTLAMLWVPTRRQFILPY